MTSFGWFKYCNQIKPLFLLNIFLQFRDLWKTVVECHLIFSNDFLEMEWKAIGQFYLLIGNFLISEEILQSYHHHSISFTVFLYAFPFFSYQVYSSPGIPRRTIYLTVYFTGHGFLNMLLDYYKNLYKFHLIGKS